MKTSVEPRSACSSFRRLTIAAWTETSSAETGSSATITRGFAGERARDRDALLLAARELVRLPRRRIRPAVSPVEQARRLPARLRRARPRRRRSARLTRSRRCGSGSAWCRGSGKPSGASACSAAAARRSERRPTSVLRASLPGARRLEPGEDAGEGGLAAAGLADDGERPARGAASRRRWRPATSPAAAEAPALAGSPCSARSTASVSPTPSLDARAVGPRAAPRRQLGGADAQDAVPGRRRPAQRDRAPSCSARAPTWAQRGGEAAADAAATAAADAARDRRQRRRALVGAERRAGSRAGRACRGGAGSRRSRGSRPPRRARPRT